MNAGRFCRTAAGPQQDAAELIEALSDMCSRLVFVQTAASRLMDRLREEVFPEGDGNAGSCDGTCFAAYDPGPPRLLYLVLPEGPPRLEVYWSSWPRTKTYAEVRDRWRLLVRTALENAYRRGGRLPETPFERYAAFFTFHFGTHQLRDADNYAVRFIVNALRHEGMLADDTFDRFSFAVCGVADAPLRTEVAVVEDRSLAFAGLLGLEVYRKTLTEMEMAQGEVAPECGKCRPQ